MTDMNPLLRRQIKKSGMDGSTLADPAIEKLLALISENYDSNDEERRFLERSFEISSREYQENLSQIRILQAQVIHNEKLAGIGQLSAGIAHEINNPLGFVQSNLDTLKKHVQHLATYYDMSFGLHDPTDSLSEEVRKSQEAQLQAYMESAHLEYILEDFNDLMDETTEGLHRIEKIVKSLLGFTRKGYDEEFIGYDLNKGIRETLTIANNEIKYHAKVEAALGDIPMIPALAGEINQVLLNLVLNAGYAIKEKNTGGSICVRTYADRSYVYCEIADDGMGIPESHIQRIFEPFYTTKPVGIGTGLGLSIAHDIIVNKHKGAIEVNSEAGCGTTFTLKLPISEEPEATAGPD